MLVCDGSGKYQGIIGVVVAFGYAVGPVMGGALAQKVSWRVRARSISAAHNANICLNHCIVSVVLLD